MPITSRPDVVVVGAGYVGLTLALHMASNRLSVLAVDIDENKIADLQNGKTTIFENGIEETLRRCVAAERLQFSTICPDEAPAWIIAISYFPGETEEFLSVLDSIRNTRVAPPLVMIRGTVPVGYTRSYIQPRLENHLHGAVDEAFYLVSAPERTLSGAALNELSKLPQLMGGSQASVEQALALFKMAEMPCVVLPNFEAAEIAKNFTNFARLAHFNLVNFLGVLCHEWNLSEQMLMAAITGEYPRLSFLSDPGPGVGGFCLPKDCLILHDGLQEVAGHAGMTRTLANYPHHEYVLNEQVIQFHTDRVLELVDGSQRILAMGMAFKGHPQTNDTRGSFGVRIVHALMEAGKDVQVCDKTVGRSDLQTLGLSLVDPSLSLSDFDAVLLLNNDPAYRQVLAGMMSYCRNIRVHLYDPWRLIVQDDETIFQRDYPLGAVVQDSA